MSAKQRITGKVQDWLRGESSVLDRYFFLSYLVVMLCGWRWLKCIAYDSWVTGAFAIIVFVSYCYLYLIPAKLIVHGVQLLLARLRVRFWLQHRVVKPASIVYSMAVFLTATIDVLAFTDFLVYRVDGHHVTDTFILNLIFGRGGLSSLGADTATILTFIGIILAFIALQALIMVMLVRWKLFGAWCGRVVTRSRLAAVALTVASLLVWQGVIFGFSKLNGYLPVVDASDAFPLYVPVTYSHIAQRMGYVPPPSYVIRLKVNVPRDIVYPLKAIEQTKEHNRYNIIWMVAESWRYDMLDPNIMPQVWQFSQEAQNFHQHYSTGNETRMAIFGMFYGLYGNYWWACLDNNRGPVLIDVLLADNYQMCMMTSSNFKYPEYMETMFARLPKETVHEDNPYPEAWKNDRRNIDRLIDFIGKRDQNRSFMAFMFFESTHSRYYFPLECEIAKPYLQDFNYTTTDITKVGSLIKNRYINSCNCVDSQMGRMIDYLKENGLMDSTIVMITGDHGEEFMEAGRWGHGSDFTDWQTRVPMVLWMPGEKPRVIDKMTSHLDLPATVLSRLGVKNPPEDYSLGFDMLGEKEREFTVAGDWYNIACVDHEYKAVFPIERLRGRQEVTTKDDGPVEDPEVYYETRRPMLMKIVGQMRDFAK